MRSGSASMIISSPARNSPCGAGVGRSALCAPTVMRPAKQRPASRANNTSGTRFCPMTWRPTGDTCGPRRVFHAAGRRSPNRCAGCDGQNLLHSGDHLGTKTWGGSLRSSCCSRTSAAGKGIGLAKGKIDKIPGDQWLTAHQHRVEGDPCIPTEDAGAAKRSAAKSVGGSVCVGRPVYGQTQTAGMPAATRRATGPKRP